MPLSQQQKAEIEQIFLEFNEDKTGALSYEEFYYFLRTAWASESSICSKFAINLDSNLAHFIFFGAASECTTSVLFSEVFPIIEAIYDENTDFIIRFTFKAMDPERSNSIPIERIPQAASVFGFSHCQEAIYSKIHSAFGNDKQNLTFQEFYQLVTNVPSDRAPLLSARKQPETSQIPQVQKSACCLLI
ncbi:hypothetical protein TRFO_41374 [Tritrichomonas foetus]|uniref:EF-hand domain-containing protein n=1 Tax=Tritrichomonas foetus TaxID=1144522 RepID=A0A1J4L4Y8_9EUKA|nr:hypothetical protein TRFO_41374 [Tritrichomonas foetus]|eukprot:OHT16997.1 hypothetical protein TRFO_41374 [Tritrichomonas foetus]